MIHASDRPASTRQRLRFDGWVCALWMALALGIVCTSCGDPDLTVNTQPTVTRCIVTGTEDVSGDRIAEMQSVVDELLRERLRDDYPLPLDVIEPPLRIVLAADDSGPDGAIELVGDPSRERVSVRAALCRAYLARARRRLPIHAWFRDGLILSLSAEPGNASEPLPEALRQRMDAPRFVAWIGSTQRTSPGQDDPDAVGREHQLLARSLFDFFHGATDPQVRSVPQRYFATFVDLATKSVNSPPDAGGGPAADILAEQRRQVPQKRALKSAFSPPDPIDDVRNVWLR